MPGQHFKATPIPLNKIPEPLQPVAKALARDTNAAIVTGDITTEGLHKYFTALDEWVTQQRNSLPEAAGAAG